MLLASSHLCQLLTAGEHCEENLGEPSSCQVTADLRYSDSQIRRHVSTRLILDVRNISRLRASHHRITLERLCVSRRRDERNDSREEGGFENL